LTSSLSFVVDNGDLEISSTIAVKLFSLSEQAEAMQRSAILPGWKPKERWPSPRGFSARAARDTRCETITNTITAEFSHALVMSKKAIQGTA